MKTILLATIAVLVSPNAIGAALYPMAVGDEWTYTVSSTYPACPTGDQESKVLDQAETAGRMAFEVQGACANVAPTWVAVDGDTVDSEYAGSWWRLLDPAQDGHSWTEFRTTATWKFIGPVTVAAGTFQNCWQKTRNVPYTDLAYFCPNVGMVRSHMVDLAGGYIDQELKSFELK